MRFNILLIASCACLLGTAGASIASNHSKDPKVKVSVKEKKGSSEATQTSAGMPFF